MLNILQHSLHAKIYTKLNTQQRISAICSHSPNLFTMALHVLQSTFCNADLLSGMNLKICNIWNIEALLDYNSVLFLTYISEII